MKKYLLLFIFILCFIPNMVFAEELVPNGESSILIEANTGKIIFEKEKDKIKQNSNQIELLRKNFDNKNTPLKTMDAVIVQ